MKYWKTVRPEVIDEIFLKFLNKKRELTFWQQLSATHRMRFSGHIADIKDDKCIAKIDGALESHNKDFLNKDLTLFSHEPKENIIFKKENFLFNGTLLEFKKPNEIQISEKRTVERFYYKYQDHKSVTFSDEPLSRKEAHLTTAVLVDISIRGIGFVIDYKSQANLQKGDVIYLKNLTDQVLPAPFGAKVCYIEPYSAKENEDLYKIGILFDRDLDSISYKSITSIVEKKQQKTMGLRPDRYCGLTLEEQASQIRKVAKENRQLARNIKEAIDYLDTLRYLTTQMKKEFLLEVNLEVLATALRLSSKELIFELFNDVTKTMQNEFLEKLAMMKPASAINRAQDQICQFVREKEGTGQFILDPLAYITYV